MFNYSWIVFAIGTYTALPVFATSPIIPSPSSKISDAKIFPKNEP